MDMSDNAEIAVLQEQVKVLQKQSDLILSKVENLETSMDNIKGGKNAMIGVWMFLGGVIASVIGGISQGAINWHS